MIFIIALGFMIFGAVSRFIRNERSPVIATKAKLVNKYRDVHTHTDSNGVMHTDETLYLTYELDTGSSLRLTVNGRIYRNAPEYEWGTLTFQGTRFIRFECGDYILER